RSVGRAARRQPDGVRADVFGAAAFVHGGPDAPRRPRGASRKGGSPVSANFPDLLPLVFTALMGASVLAYVVLDGYDLGVGMLMPAASAEEQATMVASIGPFWDANETWLVLGIGILLAAFPLAHGVVLTALYVPVVAMLVG